MSFIWKQYMLPWYPLLPRMADPKALFVIVDQLLVRVNAFFGAGSEKDDLKIEEDVSNFCDGRSN